MTPAGMTRHLRLPPPFEARVRVLFVFPDLSSTVTDYTGVPHYGIAVLSALLRRDGHDVSLFHITREPSEEEFRARVRDARPDLVAFSAISHYARRLRTWTTWAHQASGARVIVGGVHATYATDEVAALPDVHFTCVGEGEEPLRALCDTLEHGREPAGIPGLWRRDRNGITGEPPRGFVEDLDSLPDPDLGLFDFGRLYTVRQGTFTYVMSRGCGYKCSYCSAHTLRRLVPTQTRFWRFLSPVRAVDQLAGLLERHMPDARVVSFSDAIFCPNRRWLADFTPRYRARIGLPISCNMRADMIDEEVADLLAAAGVRIVRMGVESGDEHMTREVLQRQLGVADLRRAYALLRARGIERWSYNMVGLPGETLPMALSTARLNAEIDPELAMSFIFYPYPGTGLHRLCRERGYLTEREYDTYKVGVAIRQPSITEADVMFVHRNFHSLVGAYRRARRLPGRLAPVASHALDVVFASPLLPRAAVVGMLERYRRVRHRFGERLLRRSPRWYRLLGGRSPKGSALEGRDRRAARDGVARAEG